MAGKQASSEFWTEEEELLYCAATVTAKLICSFAFTCQSILFVFLCSSSNNIIQIVDKPHHQKTSILTRSDTSQHALSKKKANSYFFGIEEEEKYSSTCEEKTQICLC